MNRRLCALVVLTCFAFPRAATAQDDPRKVQAEAIFAEGLRLHDASRESEALAKYREAYVVYPTPNILFAIARIEQVLGQSLEAIRHFREALRNPALRPRNQELGRGYVAELEKKLARLRIRGPKGLQLMLRGKEVVLPYEEVIDVEPGSIEIRAPFGGRNYVGSVVTLAGTEATLELQHERSGHGASAGRDTNADLVPPGPPGPSYATRNLVAGSLAVVGLTGLGLGIAFTLRSEGQIDDARDFGASVPGGPCARRSLPTCGQYASMLDDVSSSRTVATIGFIGGAAFVAGAAALFFSWRKHQSMKAAVGRPVFLGTGLGLAGDF